MKKLFLSVALLLSVCSCFAFNVKSDKFNQYEVCITNENTFFGYGDKETIFIYVYDKINHIVYFSEYFEDSRIEDEYERKKMNIYTTSEVYTKLCHLSEYELNNHITSIEVDPINTYLEKYYLAIRLLSFPLP